MQQKRPDIRMMPGREEVIGKLPYQRFAIIQRCKTQQPC